MNAHTVRNDDRGPSTWLRFSHSKRHSHTASWSNHIFNYLRIEGREEGFLYASKGVSKERAKNGGLKRRDTR